MCICFQAANQDIELFKWSSTPMPKLTELVGNGRKHLPPLSLEQGTARMTEIETERSKGAFDARPIPVEVKKRVQRMEDRIMKHPVLAKVSARN